ncbi:sensor histidine kinase [Aurantiacibacter gangjinensis]|uniref:Histidine kinase n=1 Tax=Aurantiacibacter gangjinensis TaxID=502682 RepID=A0A0G9MLE2_9SPHN|nr:histidine kinase [Aurantiacibacter gangjinensis]APE27442.1 Autolysin sensor kinase [Aurantiacibacter gangjinensis]KLE31512.1 histidine kinase [Aurantiacibacter gangjinensis]
MAVLPIEPVPFFEDKNRAFWRLQMLGWGGAFVLRVATSVANERPWDFLIVVAIAAIAGFSISSVLSVVYSHLINRSPVVTWTATTLVLLVAVSVSAFINAWTIDVYQGGSEGGFIQLMLGVFYIDMALLGAWSALYYAINFFLQVEQQADRLERLEAQATSAQLAMLRYQLNPHFLFNTLNSISTLVLLKQTEPANAMLTRLSGFLRHTLVNQPGGKVTVAQEVETLKLYLDIERMRFEERLRTDFRIDDRAAHGCIPSFLLQPLVENAIKYGVSAQEEGARISLAAQVIGSRLRLTVSDTGPGLQGTQRNAENIASQPSSTGVGLANIRDRLAQAYGEDHRFDIETPPDGGFTVIIELPFEREEPETAPQKLPAASPVGSGRAVSRPETEPQSVTAPQTGANA